MANKRRQFWLIFYYLPGIKEKQNVTTPALRYPWECQQWLLQQKPSADIVSVQPYRAMALTR